MFVRFRQSRNRLQASLVETRRVAGKVRHEHIASLGAVDVPPSIRERLTFWARLPERLDRLANRIDGDAAGKIYAAVHARIPMVTPEEQRSLQEENAKADEQFWSGLRDMHAENVEGHKGLIATAERAIATGQAGIAEADAKTTAAKERLDRLARGETVAGGFGKPIAIEEVLKADGWTASDLHRVRLTHAISEAGGFEDLLSEIGRRSELAENSARRAVAARLGIIRQKRRVRRISDPR
jgi:hypothetical protein